MDFASGSGVLDPNNPQILHLASLFQSHRNELKCTVVNNLDRRLRRRVDPSDLLQETFIEALRAAGTFMKTKPMSAFDWLRVLARNITRNANVFHLGTAKRTMKNERAIEAASFDPEKHQSSPSHIAVKKELLRKRELCLAEMPPSERQIIELRHEKNMSNQEVALHLDISCKAASKRYYRAIRKLSELMKLSSA
ncbi:MAG: sigma-70 family RNA polymerase sigma factor [Planctomycetota bacterium]